MDANHPINRLTEREKEVLRAWLGHKSAKEIALDLGITHHAVEKRLKMARTKLAAGSSLEAARMLAEAEGGLEGYGQTITAAPDLASAPPLRPSRRDRPILFGGIAMSLAIVLALSLATGEHPAPDLARRGKPVEIAIDSNLEPIFDQLDENGSGYLESPESPFVTLAFINPDYPDDGPGTAVLGDGTDPAQVSEFYGVADTDLDDRVSFREYYIWSRNQLAAMGIATSMVLKAIPEPGDAEIVFTPDFEHLDEDKSGFLEGKEAPQLVRFTGNPTLNRSKEGDRNFMADRVTVAPLSDPADFYQTADSDRDGKVSRREFEAWAKATSQR
jgi:DNA-binding CsgD family transcriptional regulator